MAGKNSDTKTARKTATSKASVKRVLATPIGSSSPRAIIVTVAQNSTTKFQTQESNNDKVQEITLHGIEGESENKRLGFVQDGGIIALSPSLSFPLPEPSSHLNSQSLLSPDKEDRKESVYSDSEPGDFISENWDTVDINEVEIQEGHRKKTLQESGVALYEDRDCKQMKFQEGNDCRRSA
ncbi:unnamed protein product [Ilex paraguariensis]|uniref:Uncharacterized protein n=1 Tax=Ilex paraguariensis TaxID=185542 RepID=A0ABC8UY70_9AQUA